METVNEYKIGDKVVVRKDLVEDKCYGNRRICCIDDMVAMGGQTLTISGVDVNRCGCKYYVDENGWVWAPEMFSTGYEEEVEESQEKVKMEKTHDDEFMELLKTLSSLNEAIKSLPKSIWETEKTDEIKCELAVGDTAKLTRDELAFKGEIKKGTMVKVLVVESDGSCLIGSEKINGHSGDAYYDCHSDTCPEKYEGHCWFMDVSGLEKVEQKPAPKTKYRVGDKVIYNGVMSNHEDVEGVIIHTRVDDDGISRYTVGFDSPIAHSHDGMDNEIGIDSIEHVKKKYRHYVEDNRCIFARDRFLRLYEEPKEESKPKVGDRVCLEGVIASTGDDGSVFIKFDGEEKISPTYISPSAKFKKVEK